MKRGQLLSQPFIYIFALIFGALILVWGIKTVIDFKERADLVELGTFLEGKGGIKAQVNKFYMFSEGSIKDITFRLDNKLEYMCILDPETYDGEGNCWIKTSKGKILEETEPCNSLQNIFGMKLKAAKTKAGRGEKADNLFFIPSTVMRYSEFRIEHLKPVEDKNPLCIENGGKMRITSKVTHVEAS